jgi:COP9 signalosome complex subunit 5
MVGVLIIRICSFFSILSFCSVRHYRECKISALAGMKMLKHALTGVSEGRAEGGTPVEIMGLMIGKPDGNAIVVTDVFPIPVKGIEYQVDVLEKTLGFMTLIQEALELRRNDRFIGWYHSHPFDVEAWSHCHLSATDVATQSSWQFSSPFWTAIVVDPLRSVATQSLELGAYRTYPADHTVARGIAPDMKPIEDEQQHIRRWGVSAGRYYELPVSYFSSAAGSSVLAAITKASLWSKVLSSTPAREREALTVAAKSAGKLAQSAQQAAAAAAAAAAAGNGSQGGTRSQATQAATEACGHAVGQCCSAAGTIMKLLTMSIGDRGRCDADAAAEGEGNAGATAGACASSCGSRA